MCYYSYLLDLNYPMLKPAKHRYYAHKSYSKSRNIPFLLTFEEWYDWWLANGIDKNQSMVPFTKQTLCMCRYGDKGPYSLNNIYCATQQQNLLDLDCSFRYKSIQTPNGKFNRIKFAAEYYNVHPTTIYNWLKSKPNEFYYL